MMILVTGGSCSGKSAFAEKLLAASEGEKYYIATMEASDPESLARIERHRTMREGKGFLTVEQGRDIHLAGKLSGQDFLQAALLECVSNLVANEMFGGAEICSEEHVAEKICRELQALAGRVDDLIIVTNNVFEDGVQYDAETMAYLRAMGAVNGWLARRADAVYEVVAGIPIRCERL